jgi:hypothetical protein
MTPADSGPPDTPPDETFSLSAAATEFYERFPHFEGKMTFVDVSTGDIINSDPQKGDEFVELFHSDAGKERLQPIVAQCQKARTSYSWQDGAGNYAVFIYTGDDRPRFFGDAVSPARELQFIFDHEVGHAVVPEGSSDDRLTAENAADAYALICDLQRHGGDAALAEAALLFRTSFALFNKSGLINFSAPTIETIIGMRSEVITDDMTPEKTVALAGSLATARTMGVDAAKQFADSLEKLRGQPSLGALANIVLETPLPDTFKWTSTVLKAVLERKGFLPNTTTEAFNAAARDLPPQILLREKEFAAGVFEKRVPKAPPPAPGP